MRFSLVAKIVPSIADSVWIAVRCGRSVSPARRDIEWDAGARRPDSIGMLASGFVGAGKT